MELLEKGCGSPDHGTTATPHCGRRALSKCPKPRERLTWVFSLADFLFSELWLLNGIQESFPPNSQRESEKTKGFDWEEVNVMDFSKMMEILLSTDPWTISAWGSWTSQTFQYMVEHMILSPLDSGSVQSLRKLEPLGTNVAFLCLICKTMQASILILWEFSSLIHACSWKAGQPRVVKKDRHRKHSTALRL